MIQIVTDGACNPNPGPGGWAALIVRGKNIHQISGRQDRTTNNRMEMTAVLEGLRAVAAETRVTVVTDSMYVVRGMREGVATWRQRGWQTVTGDPVNNRDLWEALAEVAGDRVRWVHVRGHKGHRLNERADRLARRAVNL